MVSHLSRPMCGNLQVCDRPGTRHDASQRLFGDQRFDFIMPAKQNTRKNQNMAKRKQAKKTSLPLLPRVTMMPPTKHIVMTFAAQGAGTEAAAATGLSAFYRLNSVYDPDASGVGSACGGYNTWAALFLNYKVNRVTVRIQGTCVCSTGSMCQVIIAPVANQSVVPTGPNFWKLIPFARVYTVVPNANGGKTSFEHVESYDNAKVARVTKEQYATDMDFSGTVGSNPARQNYLLVGMHSINSTTPGTLVNCVQITYDVEWFNPVPMQG